MSVETESATTLHGSVEYEVVECDSCGSEVMKDDAAEFTLGRREGWACDWCTENGPIGFPNDRRIDIGLAVVFAVFWPVLIWLALYGTVKDRGASDMYYAAGAAGALLYAGVWLFMTGAL